MKSIFLIIFCILSFLAIQSKGSDLFSSNLGRYKIESCEYTENGSPQLADSWCKDYTQFDLSKERNGFLNLTFLAASGGSITFPIEVFDRSEGNYKNSADYKEYGDYHVWTHTQSYPQGYGNDVLEIESYVFNFNHKNETTLSINKSRFLNAIKRLDSNHLYIITKLP